MGCGGIKCMGLLFLVCNDWCVVLVLSVVSVGVGLRCLS